MANTKTVDEVKELVGRDGYAMVPITTIEHVLGAPFTDDDDCDTQVGALVAGSAWLDSYEIDFINRIVLLRGPKV